MITYDYYRIFYFVAQYHSFTKAAEILKNNQPNITRCMNNLESELGCKLFIRSHQGVTLTAEGEKVYERVAVAYEQLRTVEEELARDALKSRTVCRIPLIEEAPKREICLIINPRQHQNAAAKELIGELLERV